MGLTMAEVAILIIFVLLLLLGIGVLRHKRLLAQAKDTESISRSELLALREASSSLQEINAALGLEEGALPEEITRLKRLVEATQGSPDAQAAMVEARKVIAELHSARSELQRMIEASDGKGPQQLARAIEAQAFDLQTKEGQLRYVQERLEALGSGGERPCWVERDGTVMFIYDVLLTSHGIRMRERASVAGVRARFPLPQLEPEALMSPERFLTVTRPLYDYGRSDARQCRFHVMIYDGTAAEEKSLYKQLVATVEGHFYRQYRVLDGSAY